MSWKKKSLFRYIKVGGQEQAKSGVNKAGTSTLLCSRVNTNVQLSTIIALVRERVVLEFIGRKGGRAMNEEQCAAFLNGIDD